MSSRGLVLARLFFPTTKPRMSRTAAAATDPTTGPAIQALLVVPEDVGDGGNGGGLVALEQD